MPYTPCTRFFFRAETGFVISGGGMGPALRKVEGVGVVFAGSRKHKGM